MSWYDDEQDDWTTIYSPSGGGVSTSMSSGGYDDDWKTIYSPDDDSQGPPMPPGMMEGNWRMDEDKGRISKGLDWWNDQWYTKPLTDAPSRAAGWWNKQEPSDYAAEAQYQRELDEKMPGLGTAYAQYKGFTRGATQGLGDLLSGLTSPLNIATTIATAGEGPLIKAGFGGLGKIAGTTGRALSYPVAIAGGAKVIDPESTMLERGMGAIEFATGAAGTRHHAAPAGEPTGLNTTIKGEPTIPTSTPAPTPTLPMGVNEISPGLVELTDLTPGIRQRLLDLGYVPAGTSINGKPQMMKGAGSTPAPNMMGGEVRVVANPGQREIGILKTQGFEIKDIIDKGDAGVEIVFQKGGTPDIPRNPIVPPRSTTIPPDQPLPSPDGPRQPPIDVSMGGLGEGDYPLQTPRPYGPYPDQPLRPEPSGQPFGDMPLRDQPMGPENYSLPLNPIQGPEYPRQSPGLPPSDLPLNQVQGVPPSELPLNSPQVNSAVQQLDQQIQAVAAQLRKVQGTNSPQEAALMQQLKSMLSARKQLLDSDVIHPYGGVPPFDLPIQPGDRGLDLDYMRNNPQQGGTMRPPPGSVNDMSLEPPPGYGMNLDALGVNNIPTGRPPQEGWGGNAMSLGEPPVLDLDAMRGRQIPEPGPRIQQHEGLNLDMMPVNRAPEGRAPDGRPWSSPDRIGMSMARRTGMEDISIEQLDRMLESGDPNIRGAALAEVQRRMTKGNVEYSESVFQDRGPEPSSPISKESGFWRDERGAIDPEDDPILSLIRSLRSRRTPSFNERPPRVPVHGDEQIPDLAFQADEGVATHREFSSHYLPGEGVRDPITQGEINRETEINAKDRMKEIAIHYPSILREAHAIYSETDPRRIVENLRIASAEERKTWSAMNEAQHARLNRGIPEPPEIKAAYNRAFRLKGVAQSKYEQASTRQLMGRLISDESGHFDPATLVRNLRKALGREPTDSEVLTAMERAKKFEGNDLPLRPSEETGRVASFDPNAPKQVGPSEWDFTTGGRPPLPDFPRDTQGNRIVTTPPQTPEEIRAWYEKHKDLNSSKLSDQHDMENMPGPDDAIWGPKPDVPPRDKWDNVPLIERPLETPADIQRGIDYWQNRLDAARKIGNNRMTIEATQKLKELRDGMPKGPGIVKRLLTDDEGSIDVDKHLKSLWTVAKEAYEFPRGALSALDISGTLRQGLPLVGTKRWNEAWKPMVESIGSEAAYQKIMQEIQNRPMFVPDPVTGKSWAQKHGMNILDLDASSITAREESMASRWLNKMPGFRASNRAYSAFLNSLRAGTFEDLVKDASMAAGKNIIDDPLRNPELARQIADFVNTATGRGPLKLSFIGEREHNFEVVSKALAYGLFSPRLMMSRVRMMNPGTYAQAPKFVRQQYMAAAARTAGAWMTFAGLAGMSGLAEVNYWDPTSTDFGKIKIGNTRLDPAGGFQQYLVAFARNTSGWFTSSEGRPFELGAGYRAETREDVGERFAENKLQPSAKLIWDLLKASEYRPVMLGDRIAQLVPPMMLQDMYELSQTQPELIPFLMLPVAMGMGTQTYEAGEVPSRFIPPEQDYKYQGGSAFSQHPFHPGGALYIGPQ